MGSTVPYYCHLAYALADCGVTPLDRRLGLRWYPVNKVQWFWDKRPEESAAMLEEAAAKIQSTYGVVLKSPLP